MWSNGVAGLWLRVWLVLVCCLASGLAPAQTTGLVNGKGGGVTDPAAFRTAIDAPSQADLTDLDEAKADLSTLSYINVALPPYSLVGDGKAFVDGVAVSGDNTFTSSTANFQAGDVGKYIRLEAVGSAGADLITTIASRNSSTSVELTAAPSASLSSVDFIFGTNNTTAGQSAIDAAYNTTACRTVYSRRASTSATGGSGARGT